MSSMTSASPLPSPDTLLSSLYRDHFRAVRTYLARRLGCPEAGREAAQDIFLRLLLRPQTAPIENPRRLPAQVGAQPRHRPSSRGGCAAGHRAHRGSRGDADRSGLRPGAHRRGAAAPASPGRGVRKTASEVPRRVLPAPLRGADAKGDRRSARHRGEGGGSEPRPGDAPPAPPLAGVTPLV